jgi:hypothetical protein
MNADQLLRLAMRLLRPLMNRGINAGIDRVAGRGKAPEEMTPAERAQAKQGKEMVRRARQMARASRRIGRF